MKILARGRYGLLVLIIAIAGLLAVPAAMADATACNRDFKVSAEQLLLNPNPGFSPSEATVALATPIPAGDYTLAMVSYDEHSNKAVDQSDQLNEQWSLQLLDATGAVVYQSGMSPDLPDNQDYLTFNSSATVTGTAVTMRVVHAAIGNNVNSIVAACAGFTPVPVELGSIGDTVWFDSDGNGILDGDEAGIPGITVAMGGPVVATTTTDANGMYSFTDLPAGAYAVTVGAGPAGTTITTPATVSVTLGVGEDYPDADFGFAPEIVEPVLGSIGNMVWFDINGNGWMDDTESGLAGVRVLLTVPGGTGTVEVTTDADGYYLFDNLSAGNYDVTIDLSTAPADTTLSTVPAFAVALALGEDFVDADFGLTPETQVLATAAIGDQVWMDVNLNGLFDSGEDILPGVTVSLFDTLNGTTQTTVTGASGQYLFAALTPGTYEVSVLTASAPESTALTTVGMYAIVLGDGQTSLIADFGFAQALPSTGFETADFGIAGFVLLLIGAAALVLVRPGSKTPWHLVNAYEVR
ncbi:MAG: carboxypeptidase regulatory-like domain-containing protein [Acidimicrobiia bacterium]|nr:carboxypeptidase regulatory-like domain-containing protein [Acidimicrobiia bacterium]